MGLVLAKEYIKNEDTRRHKTIPLEYRGVIYNLNVNERFFCPDNDYIEFSYTGDEIKVFYGNNERLMISCVNGILTFTFAKTDKQSKERQHITYPLTIAVSSIVMILHSEEGYDKSDTAISRLMEYRD